MKAKHRETGGVNEAKQDLETKPGRRVNAPIIEDAAEEKKRGGRARKHVGKVNGAHEKRRADRKPRKDGGRTGADSHPFSSARHGEVPSGRKVDTDME